MNFIGFGPTLEQRGQIERDGLKILFHPVPALFAAFEASWKVLEELKTTGTITRSPGVGLQKYAEAVKALEWTQLAQKYSMID
jgi:hypothetical protein